MLTVTLCDLTGKVLFKGLVPEEAVLISSGCARPTTATIRMPITDLMNWLATTDPVPEPDPPSFWTE